ncbi:hypothetical protein BGZ63DRAFT_494005 [Mariannaea sp. PMI_226]|nr:hypothetical protein BGZ63DRAFT_494005 [Mariannaea sp. PMI_226]
MNPVVSQTNGPSDPTAAALQGASLAFNKKSPAPPPPKKDNGALTAANSAQRPRSPVKPQSTGGSAADADQYGAMGTLRLPQFGASPSQSPSGYSSPRADPKSASFIAAALAASRNSSPTPKIRTPGRSNVGDMGAPNSGEVVDSGSIPPTGSLISMFEQVRTGDPIKRPSPKRTPIRSPEPAAYSISDRDLEPGPHYDPEPSPSRVKPKPKPEVKPKPRSLTPPPASVTKSIPEVLSPKPQRIAASIVKAAIQPQTPPKIIRTRPPTGVLVTSSPDPPKPNSRPATQRPPTPPQPRGAKKPASKPTPPAVTPNLPTPSLAGPREHVSGDQRPTTSGTVSSDDTFVSASSNQSPERPSPPERPPPPERPSPAEHPSPPAKPKPRRRLSSSMPPSPSRSLTRHNPKASSITSLPLDSLTDAMLASSLASTRLTPHSTGGGLPTPPPPRRQKSPRLMQTLRQPHKPSDEEDRPKKGHLPMLHSGKKHSHHEGSRKRWREEITPRERKRYEAVWASNRGVLLDVRNAPVIEPRVEPVEYVLNIVVRQIWKRSRLPADELAEVWDLVDRQGRGILGRQEFVVGMWLIDQRLRGRKIPAKVSNSVWGSANGMKVVAPKLK